MQLNWLFALLKSMDIVYIYIDIQRSSTFNVK